MNAWLHPVGPGISIEKILFRDDSCDFVDRLSGKEMKNDPRNHTNKHEQKSDDDN
jgi:hypothetical protein